MRCKNMLYKLQELVNIKQLAGHFYSVVLILIYEAYKTNNICSF